MILALATRSRAATAAIKPRQRKPNAKSRTSKARQFKESLNSGEGGALLDAMQIATYKKALSDSEFLFSQLHHYKRRFKVKMLHMLGQTFPDPKMSVEESNYRHWEKLVCDVFIKAVLECDREKIIELADAAAFFKDKLGDDFKPHDPERLKLLGIKNQPRLIQRVFTIRQIAEQVYGKNNLKNYSDDGFSRLRRKCKELNIPIRPSRKIKKK